MGLFLNFDQIFLTNEYLSGQLTAESFASMYFTLSESARLKRAIVLADFWIPTQK